MDQDARSNPEGSRQIFTQAGRQRKTVGAVETESYLGSLNNTSGKEREPRIKQRDFLKFWSCNFYLERSTFPVAYGSRTAFADGPSDTAQLLLASFTTASSRNLRSPFGFCNAYFLSFSYLITLFTSPRMSFPSILLMKNQPIFQEPSSLKSVPFTRQDSGPALSCTRIVFPTLGL